MDLLTELIEFYRDLKRYRDALINPDSIVRKSPPIEDLREKLLLEHGVLKDEIAKLIGRTDINQFNKTWTRALSAVFGIGESKDALSLCIDYTLEAIGRLDKEEERLLQESLEKPKNIPTQARKDLAETPKAFIAHGGQSPILDKLKEFLIALGIEPLVVEEQASENRSVGDNVDYYARQADFAIILATKGDIDGQTGGFIPRGNVLIEIGKSQEIFKDRIIYLLQAGTKFPTNISEKVWGRFTTERMDDAFIKIARELTEMKILKAVKPLEE